MRGDSERGVLLQRVRDLPEGLLGFVLGLVDTVYHPGDWVPYVLARCGPWHALGTVGEAHLLFLLLGVHARVHQPDHNAVGHACPPIFDPFFDPLSKTDGSLPHILGNHLTARQFLYRRVAVSPYRRAAP